MDMQLVPEVPMNAPSQTLKPHAVGGWSDFAKDMAAIEAEAGQSQQAPPQNPGVPAIGEATPQNPGIPAIGEVGPIEVDSNQQVQETLPLPAQSPALQTESADKQQELPSNLRKFANKDGTLNREKLVKSYLELEKTLKRSQNQNMAQVQPPDMIAPVQPVQQPMFVAPTPISNQVAIDLQSQGFDANTAQRLAPVMVKLAEAQYAAAVTQAESSIESLRQNHEERIRREELQAIAEHDPMVFTDEGFQILKSYREAKPWINQSPEPWKEAYRQYVADRAMQGITQKIAGQQVYTPNPKAVTAPPAPVTAASRAMAGVLPKFENIGQLNSYLDKLTHSQQEAFWNLQGISMRHSQLFPKQV